MCVCVGGGGGIERKVTSVPEFSSCHEWFLASPFRLLTSGTEAQLRMAIALSLDMGAGPLPFPPASLPPTAPAAVPLQDHLIKDKSPPHAVPSPSAPLNENGNTVIPGKEELRRLRVQRFG